MYYMRNSRGFGLREWIFLIGLSAATAGGAYTCHQNKVGWYNDEKARIEKLDTKKYKPSKIEELREQNEKSRHNYSGEIISGLAGLFLSFGLLRNILYGDSSSGDGGSDDSGSQYPGDGTSDFRGPGSYLH